MGLNLKYLIIMYRGLLSRIKRERYEQEAKMFGQEIFQFLEFQSIVGEESYQFEHSCSDEMGPDPPDQLSQNDSNQQRPNRLSNFIFRHPIQTFLKVLKQQFPLLSERLLKLINPKKLNRRSFMKIFLFLSRCEQFPVICQHFFYRTSKIKQSFRQKNSSKALKIISEIELVENCLKQQTPEEVFDLYWASQCQEHLKKKAIRDINSWRRANRI